MAEVVEVNRVKHYYDRLARLGDEKSQVAEMERDVLAEAKSEGIDVKALKKVLAERNKDLEDITEYEDMVAVYRDAVN